MRNIFPDWTRLCPKQVQTSLSGADCGSVNTVESEVYYEASVVVESKPNLDLTKDKCELNFVFGDLSAEQKQTDTNKLDEIYIRNR